jgi:membrane protein YqaA with SNARE-associated domain
MHQALAWLPLVGDPFCLVAGLLRCAVAGFLMLDTFS